MTWVNCGCGTHLAPAPWINTDTRRGGDTWPDVIVDMADPFAPFPAGTVNRMLLSHVLEHMRLDELPAFFEHLRVSLAAGAEVLVIGPDAVRTLDLWKAGVEPTNLMRSVLEHADYPGTTDWPEATHHWNCSEQRLLDMLKFEGFTAEPLERPPDEWPHWNWASWQCCIHATLETQ